MQKREKERDCNEEKLSFRIREKMSLTLEKEEKEYLYMAQQYV